MTCLHSLHVVLLTLTAGDITKKEVPKKANVGFKLTEGKR